MLRNLSLQRNHTLHIHPQPEVIDLVRKKGTVCCQQYITSQLKEENN